LLRKINRSPYSPPSVKQCIAELGENLYLYLLENDTLVKVSTDVVFEKEAYEKMVETILAELKNRGTLSVAQVRDLFNTSRKYALALMEHLDSINLTRRDGDVRRLTGS